MSIAFIVKPLRTLATVTLLSSAFILSGCSFFSDSSSGNGASARGWSLIGHNPDSSAGIFSLRAPPTDLTTVLVRFSSPPILAKQNLNRSSAKLKLEPTVLDPVAQEQFAFESELKKLTSNYRVVYRYRLLVNGMTVVVPPDIADRIRSIPGVASVDASVEFERPRTESEDLTQLTVSSIAQRNSAEFIGAFDLHKEGIDGAGIKVGVIDTGIDYTHSMLGGSGDPAAFKAIDPSSPSLAFPNAKVVGGFDFVGSDYGSSSENPASRIPRPDPNPIDEDDHGTHVAGSIAGVGDGVTSHNGVAPKASLYGLKVFGKGGTTSDSVVIAALEWAADPNQDGDLSDALDVVNLSLGGNFGIGGILYSQAVTNLSRFGTVVVAAAGNSGDVPYVVGAPSTSDEAISVAATVDHADHNWKFRAVSFQSSEPQPRFQARLAEAIEGPVTKPIAELPPTEGELVFIGLATGPLKGEEKQKLAGKVALISRGQVGFQFKIHNAFEAGAIGAVVFNNVDGPAFEMGVSDIKIGPFPIPSVMVTQKVGAAILEALDAGESVRVNFHTADRIERPELIDTITDFSSRGPRSLDAAFKPEIGAPGMRILSAASSEGAKVKSMNGTSMAAPHIAGVVALLKQARPGLSSAEYKSLMMATSAPQVNENKVRYSLSRQGAGRVRAALAARHMTTTVPSSLSLGETPIEAAKVIERRIEIKNHSSAPETYRINFRPFSEGLSMISRVSEVTVAAQSSATVPLRFLLKAPLSSDQGREYEGVVVLNGVSKNESTTIPVLGIGNAIAAVRVKDLAILASSARDSVGAAVDMTLENTGRIPAVAFPMNWLLSEGRRVSTALDPFQNRVCDLQTAGYRIIERGTDRYLQIGLKLFEPVTTWDLCEISVLFDTDDDQNPEQELVGTRTGSVPGLGGSALASILIDSLKAKSIREAYEAALRAFDPEDPKAVRPSLNYEPALDAVEEAQAFSSTTLKIIEAPVSLIRRKLDGSVRVFVQAAPQVGWTTPEINRSMATKQNWRVLNLNPMGESFVGLPEKIEIPAGQTETHSFKKGGAQGQLVVFFPQAAPLLSGLGQDAQAQIPRTRYRLPARPF